MWGLHLQEQVNKALIITKQQHLLELSRASCDFGMFGVKVMIWKVWDGEWLKSRARRCRYLTSHSSASTAMTL